MEQMEDLDEFAMVSDITTRMAIFALAKSHNREELIEVFGVIENALKEAYPEKISKSISVFKEAALKIEQMGA